MYWYNGVFLLTLIQCSNPQQHEHQHSHGTMDVPPLFTIILPPRKRDSAWKHCVGKIALVYGLWAVRFISLCNSMPSRELPPMIHLPNARRTTACKMCWCWCWLRSSIIITICKEPASASAAAVAAAAIASERNTMPKDALQEGLLRWLAGSLQVLSSLWC